MKYFDSIAENLKSLQNKNDFRSFLQKNNDCASGQVISIRDADPSPASVSKFCSGRETEGKNKWTMGIMFHGTHYDSVGPICRDGFEGGYFTSSFDYAKNRSQYKQRVTKSKEKDGHVLAMAVLVPEAYRHELGHTDKQVPCPESHYAIPLFLVTVRDNN